MNSGNDDSSDAGDAGDAAMLRQFLTGRDEPCPQCGYNLRDLTGTRCPECGEELALRIQLVEPRQAAALAGLIGLCAGAGMNFLLLGFVVIDYFTRGGSWGREEIKFVLVNSIGFVVLGACIALWLRFWRQVRRLDVVRRWSLAGAAAMLSVADLIVFSKLIR